MTFEIAVSTDLLRSGAERLDAMAEDALSGLPNSTDESGAPAQDDRPAEESSSRTGLADAARTATPAQERAVRSAGQAVRRAAEKLRQTAADYDDTESSAKALIQQALGGRSEEH